MCLALSHQVPVVVSKLGPGVVNIGRSGLFGNPVKVGAVCPVCGSVHRRPGSTLHCFRLYFRYRVATCPSYRAAVLRLAGQQIWCPGCRGRHTCHGHVIRTWFRSGCPISFTGGGA